MNLLRFTTLLLVASALLTAPSLAAEEPFLELMRIYEQARLALVQDDHTAAVEQALVLAERAREALTSTGSGAGTSDWRELVEEIEAAASRLAATDDLEAAREEFFAVTRPLSRYRKQIGDDATQVAYCPMVKKAWLQPDGPLGNPYGGQQMERCGQVIPD